MENDKIFSIADLKEAASGKMNKMTREFYNSGAGDCLTVEENENAWRRYKFRPRLMRDVRMIDTSTSLLGNNVPFPFAVGAASMQRLCHAEGEVATSKAAASVGLPMAVSTFATRTIEDIIAPRHPDTPYIMQLYVFRDRQLTVQLIRRAEEAGYQALAVTIDAPVHGQRRNEVMNKFRLPDGLWFENFSREGLNQTHDGETAESGESIVKDSAINLHEGYLNANDMTWDRDIAWLRSITTMKILIKGVLTYEDTLAAVASGVDGIIVSNHGGRQLDESVSTLEALPECVAAAAGRVPVHIDGGIRKGSDIFKALALGASFCWISRPVLWGLAYDGQKGVELALQILMTEFRLTMALAGCVRVSDINRQHLSPLPHGHEWRGSKL